LCSEQRTPSRDRSGNRIAPLRLLPFVRGPADPAVELGCSRCGLEPCRLAGAGDHAFVVVRVVLIDACNLDAVPILGGHRGSEQCRFCGAHKYNLIIIRVILIAACNLEAVPALGGHLGRSRLFVAAVGPLVGPVIRVGVLGGDGGGSRLRTPSGVRPLAIKAEGEFYLSASRHLAGSPFLGPLPQHPKLDLPAVELGCSRGVPACWSLQATTRPIHVCLAEW
jgi:hypothetical protein